MRKGQSTRDADPASRSERKRARVVNYGNQRTLVPVQRQINLGELKNADNTVIWPAFGAVFGSFSLLNGLAQGTSATTRIGRKIVMKSVYVRGPVQMAPTGTGSSPLRMLIIYDKQTNGAVPLATDVLLVDGIGNPNNLNNSRRFVTLADIVVPCIGTAGPQSTYFVFYKKLNLVTEFNNGTNGTVSDIQTGSVYALTYTTGSIGTASLQYGTIARIRFSD